MAVAVVLFHCGVGWIYNVAVSGVTFFFISSTFLLALRHPFTRLTGRDYRRFVMDHAARLYPLHWLGLALLIAIAWWLGTGPIDWGATALSALLLHSWSPVHEVHYGLNPVAWYLCALLFIYLIYPVMSRWLGRWLLRNKVLLALLLSLLLGCVLLPLDIPGREAVFVNPLSHVLDVVVGIAMVHAYHLLKARASSLSRGRATVLECAALLSLAVVIAVNMCTTWIRPWEDVIIWLVPQGGILMVLALNNGHEGAVGRVLLCRPLQWLGSISFEMYVLQFVVFHLFGFALSPLAGHYGWSIYGQLAWFALPLLMPLSWLVNRFFTRPVAVWIRIHVVKCNDTSQREE